MKNPPKKDKQCKAIMKTNGKRCPHYATFSGYCLKHIDVYRNKKR